MGGGYNLRGRNRRVDLGSFEAPLNVTLTVRGGIMVAAPLVPSLSRVEVTMRELRASEESDG
jgi:hypothetical protein